jgi:hypothetical protein
MSWSYKQRKIENREREWRVITKWGREKILNRLRSSARASLLWGGPPWGSLPYAPFQNSFRDPILSSPLPTKRVLARVGLGVPKKENIELKGNIICADSAR